MSKDPKRQRNRFLGAAVAGLLAGGTLLSAPARAGEEKKPEAPAAKEPDDKAAKEKAAKADQPEAAKDGKAAKDGTKKSEKAGAPAAEKKDDKHACGGKNGCGR